MTETVNNINHEVKLLERNLLIITGVKKVNNFNNLEFLIETNMGNMQITGEELELLNLDTKEGLIKIKGIVSGVNYSDKQKKDSESILSKLFK